MSCTIEKQTIAANTDGEGKNAENRNLMPPYDPEKDELLTYGKTHPKRVALMWLLSCISVSKILREDPLEISEERCP